MTTAPPGYNYAKGFGIESLAAAIVFAILYVPLFLFYVRRAIAHPVYVYFILSLFSAIRITAFTIRAVLAGVTSDAENLNVFIAYEILYNVGFFGLLYSAYTLVLDRCVFDEKLMANPLSQILKQHLVFRLVMTTAVALGIAGAVLSSSGGSSSSVNTGDTLRKASIYIFFALIVLVTIQTALLAFSELNGRGYTTMEPTIGARFGAYILSVITLLILLREAFFVGTANNITEQNKEPLWYPLAAVPEFIAVCLFAVPGLVPPRSDSKIETAPRMPKPQGYFES